jgi:hypothetical protein
VHWVSDNMEFIGRRRNKADSPEFDRLEGVIVLANEGTEPTFAVMINGGRISLDAITTSSS